jgi:hypothetical protein
MPAPDVDPGGAREITGPPDGRKYRGSEIRKTSESHELTRSGRNLENPPPSAKEAGVTGKPPLTAQLQEQKRAAMEAKRTASDLQTTVASARTEIETLRSQWKNTREELESQKAARSTDAAKMAASLALIEGQLFAVTAESLAVRCSLSRERNTWRVASAAAGVLALSFLCATLWQISRLRTETLSSRLRQTAPVVASAELPHGYELPRDPHAALTTALDRLNDSLTAVPGQSPEYALRKVSLPGGGCMVVWTGDVPAVLFGQEPLHPNSLAQTLAKCAEAVARLQ